MNAAEPCLSLARLASPPAGQPGRQLADRHDRKRGACRCVAAAGRWEGGHRACKLFRSWPCGPSTSQLAHTPCPSRFPQLVHSDYNYEETLSTLRYASRAKFIKNKPRVNEDPKVGWLGVAVTCSEGCVRGLLSSQAEQPALGSHALSKLRQAMRLPPVRCLHHVKHAHPLLLSAMHLRTPCCGSFRQRLPASKPSWLSGSSSARQAQSWAALRRQRPWVQQRRQQAAVVVAERAQWLRRQGQQPSGRPCGRSCSARCGRRPAWRHLQRHGRRLRHRPGEGSGVGWLRNAAGWGSLKLTILCEATCMFRALLYRSNAADNAAAFGTQLPLNSPAPLPVQAAAGG